MTSNSLQTQFFSINHVWRYGNIGLDQLTGYLRSKDFPIRIDYFGKKHTREDIFVQADLSSDIFGFSVTSANYAKCFWVIQEIKKRKPAAVTVFGGGLVSCYCREILQENPALDYVILGDGELPSEQLWTALQEGRADSFTHISVASQQDQVDKRCQINSFVPAEPAYDYYETDSPVRNSRKVHCIQTKNNICTGSCSFCTERHGHIACRDLDDIVNQIEYVYTHFGVQKIFFTDDNILDPNNTDAKLRILELCRKLAERKLPLAYQCYMKATSLKDDKISLQVLQNMHDVGLVEAFVGVESGNQADLDLYHKKTQVEDNVRVIAMLRQYGIFPMLGFISFNPYSTLDTITTNFKFLCDNACTYLFNYLYSFVIINKYTVLYDRITEDGLLRSPVSQYLAVDYDYIDPEVKPILDYVRNVMVPRLNQLEYQLDWVSYSYLEHKIWYADTPNYAERLRVFKEEDLAVIRKYLSLLFIDYDLAGFQDVAPTFWQHFQDREAVLAEMYNTMVALHLV